MSSCELSCLVVILIVGHDFDGCRERCVWLVMFVNTARLSKLAVNVDTRTARNTPVARGSAIRRASTSVRSTEPMCAKSIFRKQTGGETFIAISGHAMM